MTAFERLAALPSYLGIFVCENFRQWSVAVRGAFNGLPSFVRFYRTCAYGNFVFIMGPFFKATFPVKLRFTTDLLKYLWILIIQETMRPQHSAHGTVDSLAISSTSMTSGSFLMRNNFTAINTAMLAWFTMATGDPGNQSVYWRIYWLNITSCRGCLWRNLWCTHHLSDASESP